MKKAWIILCVLILSLLLAFPAGAADSTAFNPVPISITATAVSVPVGTILPWPSSSLPPMEGGEQKWAECNGASLLRTTYSELFAQIGLGYGGGGASFSLPDLRGEFIRGWDHGRGIDAGRMISTAQNDLLKSHSHSLNSNYYMLTGGSRIGSQGFMTSWAAAGSASAVISATGGSETRPRNVSMMYVIRTLP